MYPRANASSLSLRHSLPLFIVPLLGAISIVKPAQLRFNLPPPAAVAADVSFEHCRKTNPDETKREEGTSRRSNPI